MDITNYIQNGFFVGNSNDTNNLVGWSGITTDQYKLVSIEYNSGVEGTININGVDIPSISLARFLYNNSITSVDFVALDNDDAIHGIDFNLCYINYILTPGDNTEFMDMKGFDLVGSDTNYLYKNRKN